MRWSASGSRIAWLVIVLLGSRTRRRSLARAGVMGHRQIPVIQRLSAIALH
jgi:hypothetical protein